eukprot:15114377-Ditylum_brightwellii.AAC.1
MPRERSLSVQGWSSVGLSLYSQKKQRQQHQESTIRLRDEQIAALEADRSISAQTLANTRMELEHMRE